MQVRTASCGATACVNSFGDEQLAVDMLADKLLFEALRFSHVCKWACSEEVPEPVDMEGMRRVKPGLPLLNPKPTASLLPKVLIWFIMRSPPYVTICVLETVSSAMSVSVWPSHVNSCLRCGRDARPLVPKPQWLSGIEALWQYFVCISSV